MIKSVSKTNRSADGIA